MAKKKPPLDEAARARIAARRARKAESKARRATERENFRQAKASLTDPQAIAGRTQANKNRLAEEAWIVIEIDDHVVAGLLPPEAGASQLIVENGNRVADEPFDRDHEALLWLYAEAYSSLPRHIFAFDEATNQFRSSTETPTNKPKVVLTARTDAAAVWIDAARQVLIAQYRSGKLPEEDEDLFYEFVADEQIRKEIDAG